MRTTGVYMTKQDGSVHPITIAMSNILSNLSISSNRLENCNSEAIDYFSDLHASCDENPNLAGAIKSWGLSKNSLRNPIMGFGDSFYSRFTDDLRRKVLSKKILEAEILLSSQRSKQAS